jgi:DHA2 family multidrug resistance protein-like MFS transporter
MIAPMTLGLSKRSIAITAVLAAMVLVVLDGAIVNVALPTMGRALHATPAMAVWVLTAYQSALVMVLLPCAALGESLGHRRVFNAGAIVFVVSSALCALAPSMSWLIAARFLQGLGGAALMALGLALLRFVVPHQQVAAAISWTAMVVAMTSAAGPAIGAAILSAASWPWLFAVNVPLGIFVLLAARALPDVEGTARPLDLLSAVLNAAAFACFVIGAELLPDRPVVAVLLLTGAGIAMLALVRREMPKAAPLIPLDLLRSSSFRVSVTASVLCFAGMTLGMVALPFYLQHGLGQDPWTTGLYLTAWPLMTAVAAPVTGRFANSSSSPWLCALGGVVLTVGLLAAALWPLHGHALPLAVFTMLCGLGFGLFQVPNNRNMLLSAPRERSGAAGGMQGTARLTGQTVGAIIMTLLFWFSSVDAAPRIGLAAASMLTLAAGLVSTLRAANQFGVGAKAT